MIEYPYYVLYEVLPGNLRRSSFLKEDDPKILTEKLLTFCNLKKNVIFDHGNQYCIMVFTSQYKGKIVSVFDVKKDEVLGKYYAEPI